MDQASPHDASAALAIRLTAIDKSFRTGDTTTRVLKHAELDARRGEMLFLTGPSGCGKTTLLSILCGTLRADSGEINVFDKPLHQLSNAAITRFRARHIGFIFQQFNLIPTLTAVENVSVPLLIQGQSRSRAEKAAREILARVGLAEKTKERPARLSGGQQQRVAIARALVHSPSLVICDEPTSSLDSATGHQVMELLRDAARDPSRTVIIVTHDHRTYAYADRMAEMEDGRIFRTLNSPAEIAAAHPHN